MTRQQRDAVDGVLLLATGALVASIDVEGPENPALYQLARSTVDALHPHASRGARATVDGELARNGIEFERARAAR